MYYAHHFSLQPSVHGFRNRNEASGKRGIYPQSRHIRNPELVADHKEAGEAPYGKRLLVFEGTRIGIIAAQGVVSADPEVSDGGDEGVNTAARLYALHRAEAAGGRVIFEDMLVIAGQEVPGTGFEEHLDIPVRIQDLHFAEDIPVLVIEARPVHRPDPEAAPAVAESGLHLIVPDGEGVVLRIVSVELLPVVAVQAPEGAHPDETVRILGDAVHDSVRNARGDFVV